MPKLISVTANEALEMIKNLNKDSLLLFAASVEEVSAVTPKLFAVAWLVSHIKKGYGSHSVMIHFKGIEEVQRKKKEAADKIRLDLEYAIEVLENAQEFEEHLNSTLEIKVTLSYDSKTCSEFKYVITHANNDPLALKIADWIGREILEEAEQKGILEKVTMSLEENEVDDYDPNDEAEQDR